MQDLFTRLPDELLCFILSKLKMKNAVRCSILSKRWRFLITQISQLRLSPSLLLDDNYECEKVDSLLITRVENIISNILLMHSSDLETFELVKEFEIWGYKDYVNPWNFTRESVWKWLEIVAQKNVQHLTLCHSNETDVLPPAFFSCNSLTTLTLTNYTFSHPPIDFTGFKHLISCSLVEMVFTDDESLSSFIFYCPLLQELSLRGCVGLRKPVICAPHLGLHKPVICAPHLTDLHVYVYCVEIFTVNCPKLQTFEADMISINDLRVNGLLFYELSDCIDQLKLECGNNLVGLSLYEGEERVSVSAERFVEILGSFKSLKELDIYSWMLMLKREKQVGDPLINFLERLPDLERLHIPGTFLMELAIDPIPPCLTSPLDNLCMMKVDLEDFCQWEIPVSDFQKEIAVLKCLLQNAPALETVEIQIPEDENEAGEKLSDVLMKLDARGASAQPTIRVKII